MNTEKRKVVVVIMFDADKNTKEITMGQFIEMLQKEHKMDEKIVLSEVEICN